MYVHDSLYDVATLAGSACNCTIRVNLRLLFEGITLLKVDRGIPALILDDGIRGVCQ